MADLFEEFRGVVTALARAGVPFAVCGGIAMAIHARPRTTIDIDLLAPGDAIEGLAGAVAGLGFERRLRGSIRLGGGAVLMHRLTKVAPDDPEVLMLDVIEVSPGVTAAAWESRVAADWQGMAVSVVSREGLIALKRLRASPQDLADIRALEGDA
jgi:hypothetical protein